MSEKNEKKPEKTEGKNKPQKTRGWVGKSGGVEGASTALDKDLENALKKNKKKEK